MIAKSDKILITWWSWFIWWNLVRRLVSLWFSEIYLILRKWSDIWRIRDVLDRSKVFYWSLTDEWFVRKTVSDIQPDIIYHLAANWVSWKEDLVVDMFKDNVIWTINLVSACERVWFKYFVNTWTNSEYWEKDHPFVETDFLEPNSFYGVSKASSTLYCSHVWRNHNLPIYTYRLFMVYWPYENITRLIPTLMLDYINNRIPQLSKPGSVRDFVYVDDVVDYYLNVDKIEWDFGWIYNIWSWRQYSISDVVWFIKSICNSEIDPCYWWVDVKWKESSINMANTEKLNWIFNFRSRDIFEWLSDTYKRFIQHLSLYE